MKQERKIILILIFSFFITEMLTTFFVNNSPKINLSFFFTKKITPTPSYVLTLITQSPTITPTITTIPTKNPLITSAPKIPTPTNKPTIIPNPTIKSSLPPTTNFSACPTTSNQSYNSIGAERGSGDMPLNGDPANSPEINLRLRGFGPVNEGTNLISRNGSTYGLDDQMPPQISSLYGGPVPQIAKTYIMYGWNFESSKSSAPEPATPNYKVTMLGLAATPGQKLVGLKAGRKIDAAGDVFMVLYATNTDIAFTHSPSDSLLGGYLFFFLDICVDPNLLVAYQRNNTGGRGQLPVVGQGQVFGTAGTSDVKVVVRDTMSFMDTRYKEDWWFYGQ